MAGTELLRDPVVILAARVGVADQQRDRRAGGAAFVHAGQDLDLIGLVPRRRVPGLAGGAARKVMGEIFRRDRDPRRAAIDHATDRRPMRLAEGGDAEQMAE